MLIGCICSNGSNGSIGGIEGLASLYVSNGSANTLGFNC